MELFKEKKVESSHTRTHYPNRDDENYLKHTLTFLNNGNIGISYKPVILGMFEPKERVY